MSFSPALCRRVALRHTGVITATCVAAPYLDVTNTWFALESLPLNLYFMYLGEIFFYIMPNFRDIVC